VITNNQFDEFKQELNTIIDLLQTRILRARTYRLENLREAMGKQAKNRAQWNPDRNRPGSRNDSRKFQVIWETAPYKR
jgi:hypothetical protein